MRKFFTHSFYLFFLSSISLPLLGQGWLRTFGTTTASEQGYSVIQCPDGDYLIAGSNSTGDPLIIKVGSDGGPLKWSRHYSHGGFGVANFPTFNDYHRYLAWVENISTGGYIIATGWDCSGTGTNTPGRELEMIKYDASGTFQWRRTYGNSADLDPGISVFAHDAASSVKQTTDGGFILAGYSEFGGQYWTAAAGTITTSTSSTAVTGVGTVFTTLTGNCNSPGLSFGDVLYNSTGTFIGYVNSVSSNTALTLTANAAIALSGGAWAFDNCIPGYSPDADVSLIKTSNTGALQWQLAFGGSTGSAEDEKSAIVIQTTDGGYAIAGTYYDAGDLYLSKVPNAGTSVSWHRRISSTGLDEIANIVQATDGGYVIAAHGGPATEGMALIKIPNNGTSAASWSYKYLPAALTGSITTSTASANVTGTGTLFTTQLASTYTIFTTAGTRIGTVSSIGTNTALTLTGNAAVNLTNQLYYLVDNNYTAPFDAMSMVKTTDGGYAIVGSAYFWDSYKSDVILLKTNDVGSVQWSMRYGDTNNEYGIDLKQTSDGGYIIGGYSNNTVYPLWPTTTPTATTDDFLYIKTDNTGNSEAAYTRTVTMTATSVSFSNAAIPVDHTTTTLWNTTAITTACGASGTPSPAPVGFQNNGAPLPIKLISLTGKYQNKKTFIDWATSAEMNNDYFTIERSAEKDLGEWENIGTINGAGNSNYIRHYSFTDENVPTADPDATLFYRLRQTDYNGESELFGPVAIRLTYEEGIIIHTNATNEQLLVSFSDKLEEKNCSVKIYDMSGKTCFATTFLPDPSKNELRIDCSEWSKGVYIISACSENGIAQQKKFVKQ